MSTPAPVDRASGVELEIGGMTCASCAMRIEKKLNKLDGVVATVNYATEKARITVPDGYDAALLIAEVEKTGYTAAVPVPKGTKQNRALDGAADESDPELGSLRNRLIASIVLTVPVIAMAMVPKEITLDTDISMPPMSSTLHCAIETMASTAVCATMLR